MKVSEEEKRRLLIEIRKATEAIEVRKQLVIQAMEAGIPRKEIQEAARVGRQALYDIVNRAPKD